MNGAHFRIAMQSALVAWVCIVAGKSFTGMIHADSAGMGAIWAWDISGFAHRYVYKPKR
jgi:hypothetical protein